VPGGTRRLWPAAAGAVGIALVVLGGACASSGGGDGAPDDRAARTPDETTTTTLATTTSVVLPVLTVPPPPPPMPGARSETVLSYLQANDFACTPSPDLQADGFDIVDCTAPAGTASVRTFATTAGDLVAIEGFAYTSPEQRWLVYAATVAWEGADPAAAQAWVETTIASGQVPFAGQETTTIGGQPLVLSFEGEGIWSIVVGETPYTT
jgi:hypothetical protein